ncbi:FAD-binding domain-containing protein [Aspergillus steynii IBT 23096]|uniref:FAD-binding domain-containing protein n=1 Tax=Aspergillus steynii IBT 23096 TaxID=1392250 RepID=A0A2I2G7J0_9EURO|nr:FAD-binding domain-containing protein [Aspergillus steynii IBT 23096]PLB48823.1 FAD-binding domain-containing protein [Aspergillus steynii IBT 23096]
MLLQSLLLLAGAQSALAKCKCANDCWPSRSQWNSLNSTVQGRLIQNQPIAKPCYSGPGYSAHECQRIASNWTNEFWIPESAIGYSYPLVDTCPPINASVAAYPSCELGNSPAYSIKATNAEDVAAGIRFAKKNNVRLVVKNTGHDISQRSQGYGSLSIWIKHIKDGLHFHETFHPSEGSCSSDWTGSAITIGGGYVWKDVYDFATKHGHVVVGGGDPTVGCIGGFLQGAGHGSLSHEFGLATDQVLEYKVVLASGETVTANACQNTDLFTALRGGGGGTYGVVLSATVKTYPTRPTLYHELTVTDLTHNGSSVLDATTRMASKYPAIVDEGFAGTASLTKKYGPWVYSSPFIKFLANDSIEAINHAKEVMNREIVNDLLAGNGTRYLVSSEWSTHPSWAAWYASTHHTSAGNRHPLMASRFFHKEALSSKEDELFNLLETLTTELGEDVHTASSTVLFNLVAGGKVFNNVPHTSVNPAWREAYLLLQSIRKIKQEFTIKKLGAMKDLAPGTGTYVNEADPYDPNWKQDWFGDRYDQLLSIKKKYDPEDVFWCWRCVGNEGWEEVTGGTLFGPLCQVN